MSKKKYKGLSISKGIAIGAPFFPTFSVEDAVPEYSIKETHVENEVQRYRLALFSSKREIKTLQTKLHDEGLSEIAAILETHLEILQDPFLTTEIEDTIRSTKKNPEHALRDSIHSYKISLSTTKTTVFAERVQDVTDISKRILNHLLAKKKGRYIPPNSILITEEIFPSFVADAELNYTAAVISRIGGISSHAAIIARAKGIPFVAGIDIDKFREEKIDIMIVDGDKGEIIINPDKKTLQSYVQIQQKKEQFLKGLDKSSHFEARTKDKFPVQLLGNLERVQDIDELMQKGAAGIGLFRSEFLFLSKKEIPSEEEQYRLYSKLLKQLDGKRVIIRVFDIGADKVESSSQVFSKMKKEPNPVLGCRAIRFLLQNEDLFEKQLRALLRSSIHGNLHILLPMITDVSEIAKTRKIIERIKKGLKKEKVPYNKNIPIGCMMEVPSAAILSDVIAREVDFLSIGTNDLTQYLLAVDRSNPEVNNLYSSPHPALFRLIYQMNQSAKKYDKPLIVCGEIASDPMYVLLLLGLGIDQFSIAIRQIFIIKNFLQKVELSFCKKLAINALRTESAKELADYLHENLEGVLSESRLR